MSTVTERKIVTIDGVGILDPKIIWITIPEDWYERQNVVVSLKKDGTYFVQINDKF